MAELTDAQKVLRNDTGKRIAEAIEALGGTPPIGLGMTGATPGQVPVINTVNANGVPTSYRPGAGGGGEPGPGVPAGGTAGQVLAKSSSADYATTWVNQSGGGGTSDYDDLTDKPSINNVTLSGNKTAADLDLGTYSKPSGGIPQTDLAQTVQNKLDNTVVVSDTQPTETENKLWVDTDAGVGASYQIPTVAEMDAADAQTAAEIGIVITGKRPSMAVTARQYVIVRGSTISGITDGLYTANAALSPSTDVTAANLTAVGGGGLNGLQSSVFQYAEYTLTKLSTATNWTIIRYHACKLGKIAFLQIIASVTAAQDSSGVRIFSLPQDLWPRYGVETRVTSAEFAMDVNVNITVEGNMAFTRGGSTAGNIRMDFCYPTN